MCNPISSTVWRKLSDFVNELRAGKWPGGAQVVLNFSPDGRVTSFEIKGRVDIRRDDVLE